MGRFWRAAEGVHPGGADGRAVHRWPGAEGRADSEAAAGQEVEGGRPGAIRPGGAGRRPETAPRGCASRLPPEAAFSGRTAAWLHGLDVLSCSQVEVTVPADARVSHRAGV